ncbi:zinc finger protein CONSTANS-LIKE 5 [Rhododendron vialii]|uniref:zinc finger protein CONSTANS-LIKE 5 n=1 Tax=Rhododendron vialii TaxID=182163 RepID=UPI002660080B|nr:zinc finger protein CONSTANS-LIKE 5 [Rhododendron vialii]
MGMDEKSGGGGGKCLQVGWGVAAKLCDSCKAAAALLFCRADSAFLCIGCDAKVHSHGNARHERVWMCEVCEQAPASVTCKADAAALCVTCDADIHSANPLAHRHERIPVIPFYDSAESVVESATAAVTNFLESADDHRSTHHHTCPADPASDPPSWVIPNPTHKLPEEDAPEMKSIELLFSDPADQFLDFDYPIGIHNSGSDSVVPVQPTAKQTANPSPDSYIEIDFTSSKFNSFNNNNSSYTPQSVTHSFSSSSMDVGVVPDGSSVSEISYSYGKFSNKDLGGTTNTAPMSNGSDRQARVLRYREKRKNRKFEKTIRYASRKAYAETRPRIKGRFAKRTETEPELVKRFFNSGSHFQREDAGYGVVPSYF